MTSATPLADDDITRASTTAAEEFTDAYYNALDSARKTISSFYIPPTNISPGRSLPLITYNGQQLSDPAALQAVFEDQMPFTFFEVQSLNVHVTNPMLTELNPTARGRLRTKELEQNMSLLVQVSGYVRLQERKEGPMRGFSDSFVLVPNKEQAGGKGKAKSGEGRNWLIQTQNFRFVV
ncbi:NTF2-like protein [Myriangium duriaei CBS 260.36]|uniref:NTF2-like protein n=1 Tax=Myriangium duriaei CBS 260.36 TaxID=1168546 RepID=A0A9P4J8J6_9PEZI|nr:NTF2-like protein [Myriangium duriaei CBS 260.36]